MFFASLPRRAETGSGVCFPGKPEHYTVQIVPWDENGFRALSDLQDEGLVLVASAMAQSTAHLLNFFALRAGAGFLYRLPESC